MRVRQVLVCCCIVLAAVQIATGRQTNGSAKSALISNLESISHRVNEMAADFPEEKISFRPNSDVRSFAEVLLHIAGTNYYYIKAASKKQLGPEDPKISEYNTKKKVSAFLAQSLKALKDEINSQTDESASKSLATWVESIMHINEHYGNLVVYYRLNGIVPPASR